MGFADSWHYLTLDDSGMPSAVDTETWLRYQLSSGANMQGYTANPDGTYTVNVGPGAQGNLANQAGKWLAPNGGSILVDAGGNVIQGPEGAKTYPWPAEAKDTFLPQLLGSVVLPAAGSFALSSMLAPEVAATESLGRGLSLAGADVTPGLNVNALGAGAESMGGGAGLALPGATLAGTGSALGALGAAGAGATAADAGTAAATGAAGGAAANAATNAATGAAGSKLGSMLLPAAIAGSSLLSADAAKTAAKQQADAATQAANTNMSMFNTLNAQGQPYRETGYTALKDIADLKPFFTHQFNAADLNSTLAPNYQFMLDQGLGAVKNALSARTGYVSGNTLKGIADYTTNYAQNAYQQAYNNYTANQTNIFNRLSSIAGLGQTANAQAASAGPVISGNVGNAQIGAGTATGGGTVGAANALSGGLTNAASWYSLPQVLNMMKAPYAA